MSYITYENNTNEWIRYKWNPELKDTFLKKYINKFQIFQRKFQNKDISTVSLLSEFIKVFQDSAINMKINTKQVKR